MIYTYDVVLHNAAAITINRACQLAQIIQDHIDDKGTHVQGVGVKDNNVNIVIETTYQLNDLFTLIYDSRSTLGYSDFSIYYTEDFASVASPDYTW